MSESGVHPGSSFELNGERYDLVYDFNAIEKAERATGETLLSGITRRKVEHPPIYLVRGMLWAMLQRKHPQIDYATAAAMVTESTMSDIWEAVVIAWAASRSNSQVEGENPTRGQISTMPISGN